ncbi:hypothetical protein Vretimale_11888 [Volvox reticuliferus]|uniref:Mediator of RNA polymerase II transcription subunit 30 n=1 Tax=Volvox reticuliferus TaxID=1737510 RepID=A0A8J4GJ24_9CHLO|nr:hypothetical protein Vretifemale_11429 [Volvox reticuliferus]GIM07818.1 hypothetical protein Vretimale_11888 [Volvox reticuliferus]
MVLHASSQLASLHDLAANGSQQLHEVVAIVRQMFSELGYGDGNDAVSRQVALQQQYLQAMLMLRKIVVESCSLAVQVFGEGEIQGSGVDVPDASDSYDGRIAEMQQELSRKNEVVKQLMDQVRQMLESMCMWESYKHQLEKHKLAEGH